MCRAWTPTCKVWLCGVPLRSMCRVVGMNVSACWGDDIHCFVLWVACLLMVATIAYSCLGVRFLLRKAVPGGDR